MRSFCRCDLTHDEEYAVSRGTGAGEEEGWSRERGENQLIRNLHSSHQLIHERQTESYFHSNPCMTEPLPMLKGLGLSRHHRLG